MPEMTIYFCGELVLFICAPFPFSLRRVRDLVFRYCCLQRDSAKSMLRAVIVYHVWSSHPSHVETLSNPAARVQPFVFSNTVLIYGFGT